MKKKKYILKNILVMITFVFCISISGNVNAEEIYSFYEEGIMWNYSILDDGSAKIMGILYGGSEDGIISIPDTIEGRKVTRINFQAFCSDEFKEICLPSSLKCIENESFMDCKSLEEIVIPSSVSSIGEYAFYNCISLKKVEILSDSIKIGNQSFCKCSNLSKFIIHSTDVIFDTEIDEGVFDETNLHTAGPLNSGCDYEFSWEKQIPSKAFINSNIEQIIFPETIETIGEWAFSECDNLKKISLPEEITEVSRGLFYGSGINEVIFPKTIKRIGACAFAYCKDLKSMTLPDGLTETEKAVFEGCRNIEKVILPESLQIMRNWTFNGCDKLKTVGPIGSGCNIEYKWKKRIPSNAFNSWFVLSSITIGDGISEIGTYACAPDNLLSKKIVIPNSVTKIEKCGIGYYSISECTIEEKMNDFIIYGYSGSEAERYARQNAIKFVDLASSASNEEKKAEKIYPIVSEQKIIKVLGIKLKKVVALKGGKIRIKYNQVKNASGYQIQYSLKKNFSKAKIKTTKKTIQKISGLKKGKKYYFRVRAVVKANGNVYYSGWSNKKSVKVKK